MNPISESKLIGKYVEFNDKNGAFRIGKVKKIYLREITVETLQPSLKDAKRPGGIRVRVPKSKVLRRVTGKKYQEIDWGK